MPQNMKSQLVHKEYQIQESIAGKEKAMNSPSLMYNKDHGLIGS